MSLPMLPLRELRRRPSRFIVATVVLSFLATLLLFLGGLLDGLKLKRITSPKEKTKARTHKS